jgi:hypothetical protein
VQVVPLITATGFSLGGGSTGSVTVTERVVVWVPPWLSVTFRVTV